MYLDKNTIKSALRIGTRDSPLAVWQAQQIQKYLTEQGVTSNIVFIKSEGDTDLITPLYAMGVQGVFTKSLDMALLNHRIDLAVHSLKDVPIQAAEGLQQAAVLKRHNHKDILVYNGGLDFLEDPSVKSTVATGSIRRAAQWLNRFPNHRMDSLRGNVNTRLRKLNENNWKGAIFAAAGLERLGIRPKNSIDLDWMLPAPAQGAVAVYCRANDATVLDFCKVMNDASTALCTQVERDFLNALSGGCSAPISAFATICDNKITLKGNVLSVDGRFRIETERTDILQNALTLGQFCAQTALNKGADSLIRHQKEYISETCKVSVTNKIYYSVSTHEKLVTA